MKTREEVLEALENMMGCATCGYVADGQGYNSAYVEIGIDGSFIHGNEDVKGVIEMNFGGVTKSEDEDMEVWTQELSDENAAAMKRSQEKGEIFIASFTDEDCILKIMLWNE